MAAQYDVNLEKCALLKCLCGSAFAAGQAPVRSLALKISVILGHTGSGTGFSPSFFVGLGREEIKVCDAFWKQEMSPWSNAPPGLRNPFSKTYF